jgi:hypothetical protein
MCYRLRHSPGTYDYLPRVRNYHRITLTGRKRRYRPSKGTALGIRSDTVAREYKCSCGHVGWSNHIDLKRIEEHQLLEGNS